MSFLTSKRAKFVALLTLITLVAGCGLPRSGPSKREILTSSQLKQGDALIVPVNDRVTRAIGAAPALGFGSAFLGEGVIGSDTINPGDTLGLTIFENVNDGLLASQGQKVSVLTEMQVDGQGFIFVPYAGRIRAAGNTPEELRQAITNKLDTQTPDPQVQVTRLAGDGSTVSVVGGVGGQGVYPIERPTRTLSAMLARAGGVTIEPEVTQVTVIRGSQQGKVWLQDLYRYPQYDIALRGGDRILVEQDTRSYTALGATGAQRRVPFESQNLTAIEAIAQVGGLSSTLADPKGVFVFRDESAEIANAVMGRNDLQGAQRLIYVLDLTEPSGLFVARDFVIRDGDTVYVTEAPFVQWQKTIGAITGSLNTAATLDRLANTGN